MTRASKQLTTLVEGLVGTAKDALEANGYLPPVCFILPSLSDPEGASINEMDFSTPRNKEITLRAMRFLAKDAHAVVIIADAYVSKIATEHVHDYLTTRGTRNKFPYPVKRTEAITAVGRDHSGTVLSVSPYSRTEDGRIRFDEKDHDSDYSASLTGIIDIIFPHGDKNPA